VIAAGYEKEMRGFLNSNPGLRSRFTNLIRFPDYTPQECMDIIFMQMITKEGLLLASDDETQLLKIFEVLKTTPSWSNGRDIRTFLEFAMRAQARRLVDKNDTSSAGMLMEPDLEAGLRSLMSNKQTGASL
jgi:hypothetical protein